MAPAKKARSEKQLFPCPHCSKPYAKNSFRYHFEIHAVEQLELMDEFQNFACPYCPTVLRGTSDDPWTPRRRYMHVLRHHNDELAGHKVETSADPLVKGVENRAKALTVAFKSKLQSHNNHQVDRGAQIQEPLGDPHVFGQEPPPAVEQQSPPLLHGPFSRQLSLGPRSGIRMKIKRRAAPRSKKGGKRRSSNSEPDDLSMGKDTSSVAIPKACEICEAEVLNYSEYRRHYKRVHLTFETSKNKYVCQLCEGSRQAEIATMLQANRHTVQHAKHLALYGTMFLENCRRPGVELAAPHNQDSLPLRLSQLTNLPEQQASSSPRGSTASVPPYWTPVNDSATSARHAPTAGPPSTSAHDINQGSSGNCSNGIPVLEKIPKREPFSPPPSEVQQDEFLLHAQVGAAEATIADTSETPAPETPAAGDNPLGPFDQQPQSAQSAEVDVKPAISPILYGPHLPRRPRKKVPRSNAQKSKKSKCQSSDSDIIIEFEGFPCPWKQCPKRFSDKAKLEAHRKRHSAVCKRCRKLFYLRNSAGHCRKCAKAIKAEEEAYKPENWTPKPPVRCFDCTGSFDSEADFERHLESDHVDQTYDRKCTVCGLTLENIGASAFYLSHFRLHMFHYERPVRCGKCPQPFKDATDLRKHKRRDHQNPPNANAAAGAARRQEAQRRKAYKPHLSFKRTAGVLAGLVQRE